MPYVDRKDGANAIKAASPQTPVVTLAGWGHRILQVAHTPDNVARVGAKPPKLTFLRTALAELTAAASR